MRAKILYCLPLVYLTACAGQNIPQPQYSISTEYVSEYVFRGTTLAGEAIQPSAQVSVGNFTAGAWASVAVGEESVAFADEIDLYASYSHSVSDNIGLNVGATLYHYPQSGGVFDIGANDASTFEVYGGLSFDTVLSPSITGYYDTQLETTTLEAGLSHALPITEAASFNVAAQAGFVQGGSATNYEYGSLRGTFNYNITDNASVYTSANFGLSSEDTFADTNFDITDPATISDPDRTGVWFTMGLSTSF